MFDINPTSLQVSVQLRDTALHPRKKTKIDLDSESNQASVRFVNLPNIRHAKFDIEIDDICRLISDATEAQKVTRPELRDLLETIVIRGLPCRSSSEKWITASIRVLRDDQIILPIGEEDEERHPYQHISV